MLSTRPDLIPHEYAAELAKLQDDAPAVPLDQIRQVINQDLGQDPEMVFAQFEPKPLASASIAQVHVAKLQNGEDVVVKIQRPGISSVVEQDAGDPGRDGGLGGGSFSHRADIQPAGPGRRVCLHITKRAGFPAGRA